MTAKDFRALAAALRGTRPFPDDPAEMWGQWRTTVRAVTDACHASNGRFDRERFNRAAGLED